MSENSPAGSAGASLAPSRIEHDAMRDWPRDGEALFANASVGLLITADRKMVRYNAAFARMFGFDGDAAVGLPARILYPSDEAYAEIGRVAGPALTTGKPFQTDTEMQHQDGRRLWINLVGYLRDPDDPAHGTFWILDDRTEHREAEVALRLSHEQLAASEARLNRIIDVLPDGLLIINDAGRIEQANARASAIFGYATSELVGQPVEMLLPDRFRGGHAALRTAYAANATTRPMGLRRDLAARHRDGHEITVEIGLAPLLSPVGQQIIASVSDVTARRQTERQLEMAFSVAQLGLLRWDTDANIIWLDGARAAPLGYPADHIDGGRPLGFFVHPDDKAALLAACADHLAGGPPLKLELRVRHRDDSFAWIRLQAARQRTDSTELIGIFSDISARKAAERDRLEATRRLQVLQASLPDIVLTLDTGGTITEVQGAFRATQDVDHWRGQHHAAVLDAATCAALDDALLRAFESPLPQRVEVAAGQGIACDGTAGTPCGATVIVTQLGNRGGFPTGFLAVIRNNAPPPSTS